MGKVYQHRDPSFYTTTCTFSYLCTKLVYIKPEHSAHPSRSLQHSVAYSQSVADRAKSVFHYLDANKDSTLVLEELEAYFNPVDIDGDGKISKSNFLTQYHGEIIVAEKEFTKFDANSDGTITSDDVKLIFNQLDVDNDGKVTQVEFQAKYPTVLWIQNNTPVGK